MSTVAQVIDRAYREFLAPADEQPTRFTLDGTITSADTSLTVDVSFLSPEEADLLGPGTVIELDTELIEIGAYDEDTNVASGVKRGILGTTAASHTDGAYGVIAPEYPRQNVLEAIADTVVGLYPDLYAVTTTDSLALSSSTFTEIAATVMEPMFLYGRPSGGTGYTRVYDIELLDNFAPSTTGKAIYAPSQLAGGSGYLVHKASFERPLDEADDLVDDLGLQQEWERIVLIGAVAHLVAGKDLSQGQQEFLTEQLKVQNFPVLTPTRIRESLLKYYEYLLERAKVSLRSRQPATVIRHEVL